jgi:peptidyl-prolyl cis-trans isomerase-like 3
MSLTLHTSLGDMKLELQCERSPKLCENLLALAASGYYDGALFHRNIAGFCVQGGDPTGTGKGGKSIHGGFMADEDLSLAHTGRGIVSFANAGSPNTNGSQFFITFSRQPSLDGQFCVVGQVVGGLETLDAMEAAPVTSKRYKPVTDIVMRGFTIHANPFAVP